MIEVPSQVRSAVKSIAAGGIGLILAMSAIAGLAAATGTGPTTMDLGTAANLAVRSPLRSGLVERDRAQPE